MRGWDWNRYLAKIGWNRLTPLVIGTLDTLDCFRFFRFFRVEDYHRVKIKLRFNRDLYWDLILAGLIFFFKFMNFRKIYRILICKNNNEYYFDQEVSSLEISGICLRNARFVVFPRYRCINFTGLSKRRHLTFESNLGKFRLDELPPKLVFPSHNTISSRQIWRNIKDISCTYI